MMSRTPPRMFLSRALADGLVVGVVLIWFVASQRLSSMVLPGPMMVLHRLGALLVDEVFLSHVVASFSRVVIAVVIALLLGTALAILQKSVQLLQYPISRGILPFFNSFPAIGWTILAAIWFQPGHSSIILVEVAILLPFCLINVSEGLENLDREIIEMGESFTTRKGRIFSGITLPLLMPYISGGLRISYGIGWKVALVAELIGSTSGIGYVMLRAESSADPATLLSCCIVVVILYVGGDRLFIGPLTRRFEPASRQNIPSRTDIKPLAAGLA